MKRLATFLLGLLTVTMCAAKPISEKDALRKAQEFLQKNIATRAGNMVVKEQPAELSQKNIFVFNAEANAGFVVVSADDRTEAILGYSDKGNIDPNNIPSNVKWLLDSYDIAIASLDTDFVLKSKTRASMPTIAPLVDTHWGQGEPYNALCPMDGDKRSITGCVATAMAQVINYHRWPQGLTSSVSSYTSQTLKVFMPELPETTFDWDNMNDNEIAKLMLYCGQAVQMDYSSWSSGAFSDLAADVLIDVFGFSKGTTMLKRRDFSDEEWIEMAYQELAENRPLFYNGFSYDAGGHAFVVDGFQDGMFHLNWGWDGYCDGYFTLENLNPQEYAGFNNDQGMIIYACKPGGSEQNSIPQIAVRSIDSECINFKREGVNADFPIFNINCTLESDMPNSVTVYVGLGLYNDVGLVKVIDEEEHTFDANSKYEYSKQIAFGKDIPAGKYTIKAITRNSTKQKWLADLKAATVYLSAFILDDYMHLNKYPIDYNSYFQEDFGIYNINGITYHLSVGHNGVVGVNTPIAEVYAKNEVEPYSGDIYVPDYIEFADYKFRVNIIQSTAFCYSQELTSLSVSAIEFYGAEWSPKLKKLELREGVSTVYNISYLDELEEITFPCSCKYISIPSYCNKLKSIRFKENGSFTLCGIFENNHWDKERMPSLTDIYFEGDVPPILEQDIILDNNSNVTIHVPKGVVEFYKQAGWDKWNIIDDIESKPVSIFSYCGNNLEGRIEDFFISNLNNDIEFAMRIPAEKLKSYIGNKITAIEAYTLDIGYQYVFIAGNDDKYLVKQEVAPGYFSSLIHSLDNPYTITGEDIFIGFGQFGGLASEWTSETIVDDGTWIRLIGDDESFKPTRKWFTLDGWNHPIPIRAYIEGDNFEYDVEIVEAKVVDIVIDNDMSITKTRTPENEKTAYTMLNRTINTENVSKYYGICHYDKQDSISIFKENIIKTRTNNSTGQKLSLKINNRIPRMNVEELVFDFKIDGIEQPRKIINTFISPNSEKNIYIDLPVGLAGRHHKVYANVATINGKPDENTKNSCVEKDFVSTINTFPRKIVMEEATGTWCGFCPRGIVTIEKMKEQYPDNFIAIAYHDDEMNIYGADPFFWMISGFPSAHFNRTFWNYAEPISLEGLKDGAAAKISLNAKIDPNNIKKIQVATESEFGFNEENNADYRIAFVLVEDSVGPYIQNNYYSNPEFPDTPDDIMNWWIHQEAQVDIVFNNVARAVFPDYYGEQGLLPTTINMNEVYSSNYSFSIPSNILKLSNVKIVALLIDGISGEIINADETKLEIGDIKPTKQFPRKVVIEEATGTWCGFCPRGMETLERMKEKYPNNFIGIAIHGDDEMSNVIGYNSFFDKVSGFPSMFMNRTGQIFEQPFSIDHMINDADAIISSNLSFDSNNKIVKVFTETEFGYLGEDSNDFRIAYIVTEDNVGPYYQSNYYSDPSSPDNPNNYMNWWVHQDSNVKLKYNDVARAIYNDYYGSQGIFPTQINVDYIYTNEYNLSLPNNIQNIENVKIVVLLIDGKTGEILNADEKHLSQAVDIKDTIIEDVQPDVVFSIDGKKVQNAGNGTYIIRGKDGKAKKVVVK